MKVWIVKNSQKYNRSKIILKSIYYDLTNKIFDDEKITYGKYGKPYYEKFYFNISYSKNYIAIVVSNNEVGIDIEEKNRKICDFLGDKILGKNEEIINSNILNNWVIKEAYSKFLGYGLNMNFQSINPKVVKTTNIVYDISKEDYICYVVGNEQLEQVYII